jgi:uncharacterized protein YfdQ (DUF2303 family)
VDKKRKKKSEINMNERTVDARVETGASGVEAAAKLGRDQVKVIELKNPMGDLPLQIALVPQGFEALNLSSHMSQVPDRIRVQVVMDDVKSYIAYLNRFKMSESCIFAAVRQVPASLRAVFDYHRGEDKLSGGVDAGFCAHACTLVMHPTEEWKKWMAMNGKLMRQDVFAQFLEDNLADVVEPDGATLLELARDLEGTQGALFKSKIVEQTGDTKLFFEQTTEARTKGDLSIPQEFTILAAPFYGAEESRLSVRFLIRMQGGELGLGYKVLRMERFMADAVRKVCEVVAAETDLPIYHGGHTEVPRVS